MLSDITRNYTSTFYDRQREGSLNSANVILPIVFDLVRPKSVIDFGCGVGTWLATAKQLGAERCVGLEGSWIKTQLLPGLISNSGNRPRANGFAERSVSTLRCPLRSRSI